MRIDDLNSTPQTREAGTTDVVRHDRKGNPGSSSDMDADAASMSSVAAALNPVMNASEPAHNEARLEALRVQVERGEYHVSAEDIAADIIDRHRVS